MNVNLSIYSEMLVLRISNRHLRGCILVCVVQNTIK